MEGGIKDLSVYRLNNAKEDLERAKKAFESADNKLSLNRSYYAIFHAVRAVNAMDGYDSKKHSGVISHFNHEHVKNGDFPMDVSKMISGAMDFRQKSDYEDFYIVSKDDAQEQLKNAEYIIDLIDSFLSAKWNS